MGFLSDEDIKKLVEELGKYKSLVDHQIKEFSPKSMEINDRKENFEVSNLRKLKEEIDYTIKVINSPVYIGLLGRYSHGKSALVNALFNIPEECRLPVGEGVVTSKITRVDFIRDDALPAAWLVKRGDKREKIGMEDLYSFAKASENVKEGALIDYLHLELPAKEDFQSVFAEKNISLIDMPGAGSPYFEDIESMTRHLEVLDFLLVVIKITEIDKAGKILERMLQGVRLPSLMLAFTFYDLARDFPIFEGIEEDEGIYEKAIELAKESIPTLSPYLSRCVFVSSKTGFNIDLLRKTILDLVEKRSMAVEKIRQDVPAVYRRRVMEVSNSLNRLDLLLEKFESALEELANSKDSGGSTLGVFDKVIRDERREISRLKRDLKGMIKSFKGELESRMQAILDAPNSTELMNLVKDIQKDVENFREGVKNEIDGNFNDYIKPLVKENATKFIRKNLDISPDREEDLLKEVEDVIFNYCVDVSIDDVSTPRLSSELSGKFISAKSKDFFKRLSGSLSDMKFLLSLGGGIILLYIALWIREWWLVGGLSKYLHFGGIVLILGSIVYALVANPAERTHFGQMKKDVYRSIRFKVSDYISDLEKHLESSLDSNIERLKKEVEEEIGSEVDDLRRDLKTLGKIQKTIKSKTYELRSSISKIVNSLSSGV